MDSADAHDFLRHPAVSFHQPGVLRHTIRDAELHLPVSGCDVCQDPDWNDDHLRRVVVLLLVTGPDELATVSKFRLTQPGLNRREAAQCNPFGRLALFHRLPHTCDHWLGDSDTAAEMRIPVPRADSFRHAGIC